MRVFLGLVAIVGFLFGSVVVAKTDYDNVGDISKKIQENTKQIHKKVKKRKVVQQDLYTLRRDIKLTDLKKKNALKKLDNARVELKQLKKELTQSSVKLEIHKEQLSQRLVRMFKYGNVSYLEVVFSDRPISSSFILYVFNKIIEADSNLVSSVKKTYETLQERRRLSEKRAKLILDLKNKIALYRRRLDKNSQRKKRYIRHLTSEIDDLEAHNVALQKASLALTQKLSQMTIGQKGYFAVGRFLKPVKGWISSFFGYRYHPIRRRRIHHNGLDIAAPKGRKIKAANSGYVLISGYKSAYRGYGKVTVLDHGTRKKDGKRMTTVYAHQSRILVKEGQFVKKGQEIGWVGSTGASTGPHLHFEVRLDGKPKNPLNFVKI